jgi:hypothetical protein
METNIVSARRHRFGPLLRGLVLLGVAAVAPACGTKAPAITGLTVTVSFSGVLADQLELAVSASDGTVLVGPQRRPKQPGGSLMSPQSVSILLPDALAGQTVTCTATAVYQGAPIGAPASAPGTLVLRELVPIAITIPMNAHGDAGTSDGPPADAANPDVPDASASDLGGPDGPGTKALGQACANGGECDSTLCIDGVCCASACDDNCQSCNLAGKAGTCTPKPAGAASKTCAAQPISQCGFDGMCDGNGGCQRYGAGVACKAASCDGKNYVPASACDGQGACVAASPVDCTPYVCGPSTAPACLATCAVGGTDCVSPAVCANGSCGARPKGMNGAGCVAATDCTSGFCADGVCCVSACTGACTSCNQTDFPGMCLPVAAGKADPHKVCKDAGAATCGSDGLCNGAGACAFYAATTVCVAGSCKGATFHNPRKCDGNGVCQPAPADSDCTPYRCDATTTACFTTCQIAVLQCAARHTCVRSVCQ